MGDDETTEIEWKVLRECSGNTERAKAALQVAQQTLDTFESTYSIRCIDAEKFCPHLSPSDLTVADEPVRAIGFFVEYELYEAKASQNLDMGGFYQFTLTREDKYCVKFLQQGIMNQGHAENAAREAVLEAKILMNLQQHPNISQIYGICGTAIAESLLISGKNGYFFVSDHISETLPERLNRWRMSDGDGYSDNDTPEITQRLNFALQIGSAVLHLHRQNLVCYIRPDKVGFSARDDKVKLFSVGQAREMGSIDHPNSITQSDCMSVLAYTAPEVLYGGQSSVGTDVFGFGVMLWEIISLQRPFDGYDRATHFQEVVLNHERPDIDDLWEINSAELLRMSWQPFKRSTMESLYASLESMLLYQDQISELLDVAKTRRERETKTTKAKDFKSGRPSSVCEGISLSAEVLSDLENMLQATASTLKAARGSLQAASKTAKGRTRRQKSKATQGKIASSQQRSKAKECKDENESEFPDPVEESVPKAESSDRGSPALNISVEDSAFSIVDHEKDCLQDSFVGSDDNWSQVTDDFFSADEQESAIEQSDDGHPAERRGSGCRRFSGKLAKSLSEKIVGELSFKKNKDKNIGALDPPAISSTRNEELSSRRRSTGDALVEPEGEKALVQIYPVRSRKSINMNMELSVSAHSGAQIQKTFGESTNNPRRPRPRTSRGLRKTSSSDKLQVSNHKGLSKPVRSTSPPQKSRLQKQRSSRSMDGLEVTRATSRLKVVQSRADSGLSTPDIFDSAFEKSRSGHGTRLPSAGPQVVMGVDFRKPPRRMNSSDSFRLRSMSHEDFVRIQKEEEEKAKDDDGSDKDVARALESRSSIMGGLRKISLSSRNLFGNSSHGVPLVNEEE